MSSLLSIDRRDFADAYGQRPFRVSHRLTEHPLLALDALADLADFLPPREAEHNRADIPEILPTGEAPRLETTPGEIVRGIESNGCWMGLRHIEKHPDYNRLLDETLDEVMPHVLEVDGEMRHRAGFIFITSPSGTTPAHIDPEHNFLLQVRGWKQLTISRWASKEDEQKAVEGQVGSHSNIQAMPDGAETFRLDAGDGLYIPVHAPHLVKNGDTVSISLSITWQTPRSERELMVSYVNARLRRLKLSPRLPGERLRGDKAKANLLRAVHKVRGTGMG